MLQSPPPTPPQASSASALAPAATRDATSGRPARPCAAGASRTAAPGTSRTAAPDRPARRLLLGAAASLAAAAAGAFSPSAAPVAYAADASPRIGDALPRTALPLPAAPQDRLVVTVRGAGDGVDGRFELRCHPRGGSHPHARDACGQLDQRTVWGKDPFAPVAPGTVCTMLYGGPATAHVTGIWAGRPVDARFDRSNGCEIARWDSLVPVLPDLRK